MTTSNNTDRRTAPVNLLIAPMAPLILVCLTILQIHFADGTRGKRLNGGSKCMIRELFCYLKKMNTKPWPCSPYRDVSALVTTHFMSSVLTLILF